MNTEDFEKVLAGQLDTCRQILGSKAVEYATDTDRLHTFKAAAALQDVTTREALGGMMIKHTVSIYDMIRDEGPHTIGEWSEKITDHINYLILLKAVVLEEQFDNLDSAVERLQLDHNYPATVLPPVVDRLPPVDAEGLVLRPTGTILAPDHLEGHKKASPAYDDLS